MTRPAHGSISTLPPFGAEYRYRPAWGFLARLYIGTFGLVDLPGRMRARIVLRELAKVGHRQTLDFGCGTGCYSFYLTRQPQVLVSGVDINESRVRDCMAIANKMGRGNLRFSVGSGYDALYRFESGSFDSALAVEVLQYVENLPLTLKELCRVLVPGGCIIGHVPVLGYLRKHEQTLFDDVNLPAILRASGFESISMTRTFGGSTSGLCKIFEWLSSSSILSAVAFPFLLTASSICGITSSAGSYRLFVARKSLIGAKAEEDETLHRERQDSHSLIRNNLMSGHGTAESFGLPAVGWEESEGV